MGGFGLTLCYDWLTWGFFQAIKYFLELRAKCRKPLLGDKRAIDSRECREVKYVVCRGVSSERPTDTGVFQGG